jgi:manganese/zinc/iron transport system ATP- binding protein
MKKTESAIYIEDMTVAYDVKPVLWDIDLEVPHGVLMAIIGPNGAGKSTMIKSILNIIPLSTGIIRIFGKPYKSVAKQVGYVPQRNSVDWDFPTTVFDVVMMGRYGHLGWIKRPGRKDKELVGEAIDKVGMSEYKNRQISELSGGQQQRLFLARALVQDAELYLMDEPYQGVDATTEKAISNILKEFRNIGKTIVVVHHDLETVKDYFDWITILNVKLVDSGPMDDVFTVDNLKEAYGGSISTLEKKVDNLNVKQ